jgi:serine protease inhibitor
VSEVVQKAEIEVDEQGATAAAVTGRPTVLCHI